MTSANNGWQGRVSRFSRGRIQIWYALSREYCQLDTLKPDMVPINLQIQINVREDLSGAQNIPARRDFDPRPSSHEWLLPYIRAQILVAVSPDWRLVFVET
jgi:hypothetical protein